jgi:hypothetical protein
VFRNQLFADLYKHLLFYQKTITFTKKEQEQNSAETTGVVNQWLSRYSERYILDMFWEENSNELFTAASIKMF